jgi:hypothetical protein
LPADSKPDRQALFRMQILLTGISSSAANYTANLGDRTKMNVLFLNNHSKLCFSSLIYTAVYLLAQWPCISGKSKRQPQLPPEQ